MVFGSILRDFEFDRKRAQESESEEDWKLKGKLHRIKHLLFCFSCYTPASM